MKRDKFLIIDNICITLSIIMVIVFLAKGLLRPYFYIPFYVVFIIAALLNVLMTIRMFIKKRKYYEYFAILAAIFIVMFFVNIMK